MRRATARPPDGRVTNCRTVCWPGDPGITRRDASDGVVTGTLPDGAGWLRLDANVLGRRRTPTSGSAAIDRDASRMPVDRPQVGPVQLARDGVGDERLEQRARVLARLDRLVGAARAGERGDLLEVVARAGPRRARIDQRRRAAVRWPGAR